MENLVEIKNLKKYFSTPRGELHAVDNVTLNIEKGKTIGIVGESGCGKSTLGKILRICRRKNLRKITVQVFR
mgnify:CR=1 FL=1